MVKAEVGAGNNYTYQWTPTEGLNCSACPEPIIREIEESINYTVIATDQNTGCTSEQQLLINLFTKCSDEGYYIPNILYSNGNENNKMFFTKSANPEEFRSIVIRDRWGNIVYQTENIDAIWDANLNGRPLESGVYTYVVKAFCPENEEEFFFTGDLTVLR
ncbi:MAG: gliding motility-associated C-terminal domain-containing protein [Saprospiraceae bacterium]|nr:gliding motility-associated C-terminal domain-containing protein [Saprospiraceae bacterium]